LLIVAGDLCPDIIGGMSARIDPMRQVQWFKTEWMRWRRSQPVQRVLVTWGNHDYGGEQLREWKDRGADG
jgi:hypothetical protein